MSAQPCRGCGKALLAPASKASGLCERCWIDAGNEPRSYTMADVDRTLAEKNSNSGGRA